MTEHYYTSDPTSEIKEKEYSQSIKGISLRFKSVSGVFSFETHVDKASELLIESFVPSQAQVPADAGRLSEGQILDLGCGYGAIGLFIKALHPGLQVTLSDINGRAISYAKENAIRNRLTVETVQSDLYSSLSGRQFSDILTNPPIAAGKKLNTQLIHEAYDHLVPGGSLWLVAFHNKGGSTLKNIMTDRFNNAVDIVKSGGIRVYKSTRQE
jgi:16S rRNA G1207 methylase RsmC